MGMQPELTQDYGDAGALMLIVVSERPPAERKLRRRLGARGSGEVGSSGLRKGC